MKTKKIIINGKEETVENRPPLIGESWVYLADDEPIKPAVNNLPPSWFAPLHDLKNYWTITNNIGNDKINKWTVGNIHGTMYKNSMFNIFCDGKCIVEKVHGKENAELIASVPNMLIQIESLKADINNKNKIIDCPTCKGRGTLSKPPFDDSDICPDCEGLGSVVAVIRLIQPHDEAEFKKINKLGDEDMVNDNKPPDEK